MRISVIYNTCFYLHNKAGLKPYIFINFHWLMSSLTDIKNPPQKALKVQYRNQRFLHFTDNILNVIQI